MFWVVLMVEVVGDTDDDDLLGEQKHSLDGECRLIMQKVLPPAIGDEFRQYHGDDIIVVEVCKLVDVFADGADE